MGIKRPKLKSGETASYEMNPSIDEILIFGGLNVPTYKEFFELINKEEQLYKRKSKPTVDAFKQEIRTRLLKRKKPWWPHTRKLSLTINIGGPKSYIEFNDLDNYLKTLFDSIKDVVIADDHLVTQVTIDKQENQFISGFMIAIKLDKLPGEEIYKYGENPDNWEEDRKLKIARGGICCMDHY